MGWGISENASEKEKLKAEINDFFCGLNSVCDIDYEAYSQIYDAVMPIIDNMYKKMEAEKEISKQMAEAVSNCNMCPVNEYSKITDTMNVCCDIRSNCVTSLKIVYKKLQQCDELLAKINKEQLEREENEGHNV